MLVPPESIQYWRGSSASVCRLPRPSTCSRSVFQAALGAPSARAVHSTTRSRSLLAASFSHGTSGQALARGNKAGTGPRHFFLGLSFPLSSRISSQRTHDRTKKKIIEAGPFPFSGS
jgi:hypothetical protein